MIRFMTAFSILLAISTATLAADRMKLTAIATFKTGIFNKSAQEILAYDKISRRLFVTNCAAKTIDVLDIGTANNPVKLFQLDITPYGKQANSVAVKNGIVAVAVENINKQSPGIVVFFDTNGAYLNKIEVGALPDMLTFTPDGRYVLIANEGEPSDDYKLDPEGSVSIVNIGDNVMNISQKDVSTAHFRDFKKSDLPKSVKIFGPNATVAQDLEPEYITVSEDSKMAWVTLQENNAIAKIDIPGARVTGIFGLGYKIHSMKKNTLDASNADGRINITTWPVFGVFQPDAIASYQADSKTYLVTANEGDSRDYPGYSEEKRVKDLQLNPLFFPNATSLQLPENLGRLKVSTALGDFQQDGIFEMLISFGARSFSIWDAEAELVYDSGCDFEKITAEYFPKAFNATDDMNNSFDDRSDDKGPEPEALTIGKVIDRTYAFIGLERIGGIMVYDITSPFAVRFVQYVNTRVFSGNPTTGTAGDLAPEGMVFIKAEESPTGKPILAVSFEVSGTTTLFEME